MVQYTSEILHVHKANRAKWKILNDVFYEKKKQRKVLKIANKFSSKENLNMWGVSLYFKIKLFFY